MKKSSMISCLLFILVAMNAVPADAQIVTIARKIKSMRTGNTDIAHVIIEAGTANTYKAIMDSLTSNPKVAIKQRDNIKHQVQFNNEQFLVAMQVDSLGNRLSQITVAAQSTGAPPQSKTDMAVKTIVGVCNKIGIKCEVEE